MSSLIPLIFGAAFLANGQFDGGRVVITDSMEIELEVGEWVTLEFSIAG
jgi:hypothetical protein